MNKIRAVFTDLDGTVLRKDVADETTLTNEEDGVAAVLERYL